jgi:hypothetical protein
VKGILYICSANDVTDDIKWFSRDYTDVQSITTNLRRRDERCTPKLKHAVKKGTRAASFFLP